MAADDDIRQALSTTFADRWVAALPDGLDTVIGDAGHQLTPDQVQHLALARIVLGDPLPRRRASANRLSQERMAQGYA